MKANCYECIYRGNVPGDAHSCCRHPEVKGGDDVIAGLVAMFSGDNINAIEKLQIRGNAHGIRKGWFFWPANFDPVWLENCNGFTPKKNEKTS